MTIGNRWIQAAFLAAVVAGMSGAACARPRAEGDEKATPVPKRQVKNDTVKPPKPGTGTKITPVPAAMQAAEWKEATGYSFSVGGQADPLVRVFQSPDYQQLLAFPSTGDVAWLFNLKAKTTATLPRAAVSAGAEGATFAAESAAPVGAFTQQGPDMLFKAAGKDAKLGPEPPIIGQISLETLLAKKKDYALAAKAYTPNSAALSLLKSAQRPVEIVVFFGTWCSYCKHWLPRFIRTIQDADNANFHVTFYGMDEDFSQPEAEINKYGIRKTPTIVVSSDGSELGRITEEPSKSMEQDLALILFSGGK